MSGEVIRGPFGTYAWGTTGALLNSLTEEWGIPLTKVERLTVGDGELKLNGKLFGYYCWDEDGCSFIYPPTFSDSTK